MGAFSWVHWLVVIVVLLLLFGKGRFSEMMGDVAKGIKSFKKGISEDEDAAAGAGAGTHAAAQRRLAEGAPVQPQAMTPQPGDIAGGAHAAQPVVQPGPAVAPVAPHAAPHADRGGPDGVQH